MRRRDVIALLTATGLGAVITAPFALAQQPVTNHRIGFLYGGVSTALPQRASAFLEGVRETQRGSIELVSRAAEGDPARLPALAAEIVAEKVELLFATAPAAVRAAHAAAPNVPIIALDLESDPVASGFVASIARPGGNLTGVFFDFPEFGAKWLQLLREALPALSRVAALWDPSTGPLQRRAVEQAAAAAGIGLSVIAVKNGEAMGQAFEAARNQDAEALLLLSSPLFGSNPATSAELAFAHRFPAISMFPEFAEAGGLMAYGAGVTELYRQSGRMAGKVLAGAAPSELPVERPARFQLVINMKTAKALSLDLPTSLLLRADEVIE